ncbi:PEP-CTERM sorting domain-containing protein [Paraglaciecola arctica]
MALVRQSVPEPSTLVIFALGLLGLGIGRSRAFRV